MQKDLQQVWLKTDACLIRHDLTGQFIGEGFFIRPFTQQCIKHIFARAKAHGKPAGILAPVEADARRYMEWGATFVAVGSDLGCFRSATQKLADSFKK